MQAGNRGNHDHGHDDDPALYPLIATGLGLFMVFLDATIVNVGLPAIQADFRIGETRAAILAAAEQDFIQGIRVALGVTIVLLGAVFAAGLVWLPRGSGATIAEAEREAASVGEKM